MPKAPEDASPNERAQNKRLLRGVFAFFAVLTVAAAVGGYVVYQMVMKSPVANVRDRMRGQADLITEARANPGAKKMRAEGCQQAMVFDVPAMLDRADQLAEQPVARTPDQPRYVALCRMRGSAEGAPSCETIATRLAEDDQLDGKVAIVVSLVDAGGDTGPRCSLTFDQRGGVVGPYSRTLVPLPVDL